MSEMIARAVLNNFIRYQKCFKVLLTCQRKCNLNTSSLLQHQDAQNSSIEASTSILTFDSALAKTAHKSTDILETKLLKAKTSDEVLHLAAAHSDIMNNRHISTAFSLFHTFVKDKSRKELSDITHNQDFLQLCKRAVQTAHYLTPDEAITIFKTLGFLKVPSTANIMKAMCQVIRRNVNSLPLSQIVFLIFLLQKQQPTPLVEALLIALPLVLQSQLDLQMDSGNVGEMVYCLEVAATKKLSDTTIQKLSDAILLKANELTVYQACTIVASLASEHQFPDSFVQLVFKSFDILTQGIDNISDKEAMMLLSKIRRTDFFSKPFLMALVDTALERKWDLSKLSQLLTVCEKHEFVPENLLHYTMSEMHLHAVELADDHRISLTNIVGSFALVGYESATSKEIWTAISNCQTKLEMLEKKSSLLFFKLNCELLLLGCYPQSSFFKNNIFSAVSENMKKGRMKFAQELCVVEWVTKIVNTNYDGPYLPKHIIQDAIQKIWEERQKRNFFLEPFLRIGLGGDQFFETNLLTKYGHTIDHVVVLRKGDYPIAIERTQDADSKQNSEVIRYVEDVVSPSESKIVVIIAADETCYLRNSSHLKGWVKLQLHTLNKLGYLPLLINSESWKRLLSHEKIPYLMREIKEVLKQNEQEIAVNSYPAM